MTRALIVSLSFLAITGCAVASVDEDAFPEDDTDSRGDDVASSSGGSNVVVAPSTGGDSPILATGGSSNSGAGGSSSGGTSSGSGGSGGSNTGGDSGTGGAAPMPGDCPDKAAGWMALEGPVCFTYQAQIYGWQCQNCQGMSLTIDGVPTTETSGSSVPGSPPYVFDLTGTPSAQNAQFNIY